MTFSFYSPMIAGMTGLNLGLPSAWVVKCKKCGCTINCRAIDPQIEHSEPEKAEPPPQDTVIVTCSCCWAAYRYSPAEVFKGPPGPSSNCYDPNNKGGEKAQCSPPDCGFTHRRGATEPGRDQVIADRLLEDRRQHSVG
jgi:hypothetical protein